MGKGRRVSLPKLQTLKPPMAGVLVHHDALLFSENMAAVTSENILLNKISRVDCSLENKTILTFECSIVTMGLSHTVSEINRNIGKILHFNGVCGLNIRMMPLSYRQKV